MSKKSTKKALVMSVISLLACVSMLVGSTFAWFTDSVTSGMNTIAAGNLDVELLANGAKVDSATKLFDEVTLWEPGVVVYENLQVSNVGSLALKYQLSLNFGHENDLNGHKLSEVLKVAVIDKIADTATRAEVLEAAKDKGVALSELVLAGELEAETASTEQTFVIYWLPGDNDNLYNANNGQVTSDTLPLHIEFGVKLVATQYTFEEDSFDKYYDSLANPWNGEADTSWYDAAATEYIIDTPEKLAGLAQIVNTCEDSFAGKTVKLGADIDLTNKNWTPIGDVDADDYVGFKGTFDGQGHTIYNLSIDSTSWGQGLFGYLTDKNVVIKNVNVRNASVEAADTCGIIAGYATYGSFSNIHVTGDVSVIGTSNAAESGHVGGIAGCGYYATFDNCSVIANGEITSAGSFVGGIVGFESINAAGITNCTVKNVVITGDSSVGGIAGIIATGNAFANNSVEDVVLNKTRDGGIPKIGALIGCYDGSKDTTLADCTVKNVTLNGNYEAYPDYNELYGAGYSAQTGVSIDASSVTASGITNNLVMLVQEIKVNSVDELNAALANAAPGVVINAEGVTADINVIGTEVPNGKKAYTIPGDVTIKNMTFIGTYRGGNYIFFDGTPDQKIVFENCTFDLSGRTMGFGFLGQEGVVNSVEYNNCTFKGAIILEFVGNPNGVATYNNCTFTKAASGNNYVMASGGTHIFKTCTFDYTGSNQSSMGIIDTCCVNSVSESDGSNETVVILDGCTRINCGTRKYGSKSTLTIK